MKNRSCIPKKKFGQNFLIVPYYARRIAYTVESKDDSKVLEIGPGTGALSIFLKERFPRFHLIEKDKDLISSLKKKIGGGEWTLHIGDVLDFDFNILGAPLHIVGNLPYNMAAPIIRKTLMYSPHVASVTFMVQREVALRIVANPDTKQNGFLSIFCQFFGVPKILFNIPSGAFKPKPKVESSLFQLIIKNNIEESLPRLEWESFFAFVSRGFSKRRKTLAKSLSWENGGKDNYEDFIEKMGMDRKVRPENLDVHKWLELYTLSEGLAR